MSSEIIATLSAEAHRHEAIATIMPEGALRQDHIDTAEQLRAAAAIINKRGISATRRWGRLGRHEKRKSSCV